MIRHQPGNGHRASSSSSTLGTTIGGDHSTGGLCSVFYEREIAFAHTHQHPVATILALVIA